MASSDKDKRPLENANQEKEHQQIVAEECTAPRRKYQLPGAYRQRSDNRTRPNDRHPLRRDDA